MIDKYKLYENNWYSVKKWFKKDELKREGSWVKQLIGGNFNYAMTLDEIKQIIKDKFVTMKKNGFIISRNQYEKNKDKYYPLKRTNLTRIWGVEYLKKGFEKAGNKNYDVPGYVIVTDKPSSISINMYIGDIRFPMAASLKNKENFIAFEKITGPSAGNPVYHGHELPMQLGYVDLGASSAKAANIIRETKTGKYYIVDTELKSFQHRDLGFGYRKYYKNPIKTQFGYYAYEKFLHINKDVIHYLDIPLTFNLEK